MADNTLLSHPSLNPHRLAGKLCLITGASKGLGESIAHLFALHGASCILVARSTDLLSLVCSSLATPLKDSGQKHAFFAADLADKGAVDAVYAKITAAFPGRDVSILIANAGYFPDAPLETMGLDAFEDVLQVNLTVCYQSTRLVLPGMRKKKSAHDVWSRRPRCEDTRGGTRQTNSKQGR